MNNLAAHVELEEPDKVLEAVLETGGEPPLVKSAEQDSSFFSATNCSHNINTTTLWHVGEKPVSKTLHKRLTTRCEGGV